MVSFRFWGKAARVRILIGGAFGMIGGEGALVAGGKLLGWDDEVGGDILILDCED